MKGKSMREGAVERCRPACRSLCALLTLIALLLGPATPLASAPLEYQVKAAMIYNFAKFVKWPGPEVSAEPLVVGVFGDDPFEGALDAMMEGKTIYGRRIEVRRYGSLTEIASADVLYISRSERGRLNEVLRAVRPAGVLTVGDVESFTEAGGMIGFLLEAGKVRFTINVDAAREGGLQISSKLLRLAAPAQSAARRKD